MKLPREVSGEDLARRLEKVGYRPTRQSGSHVRLTAAFPKEHHITIPFHPSLKMGTLNSIMREVANHLKISKEELIQRLWGEE
jgi:predicted RNA binding protein YcfA (HicA-like mRNA interferase family)|uniref:Type II toxin-antitoxin system HicA family toxin n=1 Tax=Desulfobacca acetoxidans TaxID=60893 RepID=A0A7C3SLE2_9BACT